MQREDVISKQHVNRRGRWRWPLRFPALADLPIRNKLILLALVSSALGLLIAASILISFTWNSTRTQVFRELETLAKIAANNTTAALAFGDTQAATETLSSLQANSAVELGCLYAVSYAGELRVFASFARTGLACPSSPGNDGLTETTTFLTLTMPVLLGEERVGTLQLAQNRERLQRALLVQLLIAVLIFLVSFLFSASVAWLMQRAITRPLLNLTSIARQVSETHDYRLRVNLAGSDEVGRLIEDFNRMLSQIEKADRQILRTRDKLSDEVRQKTRANIELQESAARIRAIVETAVDGIIAIDAKGQIEAYNPAAERIFGYGSAEVLGCNVKMLMPAPFHGEHDGYLSNYMHTGIKKIIGIGRTVVGRRKDGSTFPMELAVSEMRIGGERKFTGLVRDITQRKQAELEMQRLNQSLETQVAETQQALQRLLEAQSQLVQSEKMASLGALVAGVAHEINTPVGVGVSAASTLQVLTAQLQQQHDGGSMTRSDLERFVKQATRSSELILNNLQRAADLIHSFKQVAVDQSSGGRRVFNLKTYLEEVLISLSPKLKGTAHVITVSCAPDLSVDSYPGAFAQIITNFVTNSLVHGFKEGQVGRIEIGVIRKDGSLVLSYRDDGRGVPAENVEKVFDPFFTTRRGSGGSGLGLHIVYNLVTQKLGGTIRLLSAPGRGAEFVIDLPLNIVVTTA